VVDARLPDDGALEEVASHVPLDRRAFVKRLVVTSAFAVPVVTSVSMTGVNSAYAVSIIQSGNQG
jgi:hypothetical protein